jgi:murein DD-endopeptidase MepM/ murein hydrolase activator NlpD
MRRMILRVWCWCHNFSVDKFDSSPHPTDEVSAVGKKFFAVLLAAAILSGTTAQTADFITWVDFNVSCEAMQRALQLDIESQGKEKPVSWIDLLALAATHAGGNTFSPGAVDAAAKELDCDQLPQEFLGEQYRYFAYYQEAYTAVLGGLVGNFAIETTDDSGKTDWSAAYGLKAFSPIAAGYWYNHYDDFGNARSYGFARRHLGNDLMGALGTPIVAVEGGTVEALGWNQYGGWRIGIRSHDRKRYYYYAHLRKDAPYAAGLQEGDEVQAGQVIGFMGRTGYSPKENVNNIETVHLHFGLQLIFDESQKECNSEIWVDVYQIVRLLDAHRSSVVYNETSGTWERLYPYRDMDEI